MKVLKFFGYIFGSLANVILFLVAILLIYRITDYAFETGKEYYSGTDSVGREVVVTIEPEATVSDVSKILEEKGLVKNALFFQIESILMGSGDDFVGGEYTLSTSMDSNAIRNTLKRPAEAGDTEIRVTLREGLNLKEIGEILESKNVITQESFLEACASKEFDYYFLEKIKDRENYLEGYLFPDTYFFVEKMAPELVIGKMLDNFESKYNIEYIIRTDEMGLSVDEVVKIASMLEKETGIKEERNKISAVIHNRLNQGMKLEIPSSILYVLDKRKDKLIDSDLYVDSPYNTYLYGGLPQGPVSNPGAECLQAALYPEETDILYYVTKSIDTGEHFFTNDQAAYEQAKVDYNQRY